LYRHLCYSLRRQDRQISLKNILSYKQSSYDPSLSIRPLLAFPRLSLSILLSPFQPILPPRSTVTSAAPDPRPAEFRSSLTRLDQSPPHVTRSFPTPLTDLYLESHDILTRHLHDDLVQLTALLLHWSLSSPAGVTHESRYRRKRHHVVEGLNPVDGHHPSLCQIPGHWRQLAPDGPIRREAINRFVFSPPTAGTVSRLFSRRRATQASECGRR
jgi:hypothetical protein